MTPDCKSWSRRQDRRFAALAANLAAHDLARMDGLAPDLRRVVLAKRDALQRARDLLVLGTDPGRRREISQQ